MPLVTSFETAAFSGCTSLTNADFASATSFSSDLFKNCINLKRINVVTPVKSFPSYMFQNCTALESMNIDADSCSFGEGCFDGCNSLKIDAGAWPNSFTVGSYSFRYCSSITNINPLLQKMTTPYITQTFKGCSSLTELVSDSILTLGGE